MELEIIEGPLSREQLGIVADLYGAVDAKYRDLAFLENKFNRNPAGCSLHAVARDRGVPVGHYCIIPFLAMRDGREVKAGKGEGFVVVPEARCLADEAGEPIGLAIPARLNREALARGYDWLHLHAPAKVGKIHTYCGFRKLLIRGRNWVQICGAVTQDRQRFGPKRWLLGPAAMVVRALAGAWYGLLRPFFRLDRTQAAIPELDACLQNTVGTGAQPWGLRMTEAVQEWFLASGVRRLGLSNGCWALYYCDGHSAEIIGIDPKAALLARLFLLAWLSREVSRSGAGVIRWLDQPSRPVPWSGRMALALLGFLPVPVDRTIYLLPSAGDLPDCRRLNYSPYFYVTF